jgi:acyl transferase domain-containing protein
MQCRVWDECDRLLRGPLGGQSILEVMHPGEEGEAAAAAGQRLQETRYAQPALFALEFSLAQVWLAAGVEPVCLVGHSVGEYVAAVVGGLLGLEEGLQLVARRAQLMQELEGEGSMVAVAVGEAEAEAAIQACGVGAAVSVAAVNGPQSVVVSGYRAEVEAVVAWLQGTEDGDAGGGGSGGRGAGGMPGGGGSGRGGGVRGTPLVVSHGFHSPQMEGMLAALEKAAGAVQFAAAPRIPIISNVTGRVVRDGSMSHGGYWRTHTRSAVRFAAAAEALAAEGVELVIEVGPQPDMICGIFFPFKESGD